MSYKKLEAVIWKELFYSHKETIKIALKVKKKQSLSSEPYTPI